MLKLNNILFPTDFSKCAEQALAYSVHLAEQTDAELHMMHVTLPYGDDPNNSDYHFPEISKPEQEKINNAASENLEAKIQRVKPSNIRVRKVEGRGFSVAPTILEYSADSNIDLIVMGTHGRRGLGHLFLGSVTEEVVRMSRRPVFTVREQKEAESPKNINQILVPIDFSEHSRSALTHAKEVAKLFNGGIQLLHVIEKPTNAFYYELSDLNITRTFPEVVSRSKAALKAAFEKAAGPEVPVEFYVTEGRPRTDIVDFAESNQSDLIVISTHGLTAVEKLLLGSIAEKVVRHSPCPVLTVPAFGRSIV